MLSKRTELCCLHSHPVAQAKRWQAFGKAEHALDSLGRPPRAAQTIVEPRRQGRGVVPRRPRGERLRDALVVLADCRIAELVDDELAKGLVIRAIRLGAVVPERSFLK